MIQEKNIELEVAILGGGFTGVYCARSLARHLGPGLGRNSGIISENNYMVFQPLLAEVVGASISPRHVVNPLRLLCPETGCYRGSVTAVDLDTRTLEVSAGDFSRNFSITFNHLVLALGAEIDLSRVPGMPEHALVMQNVGDAMILRATILSRMEEANLETDPVRRRTLLTFVVVGGGYSGVETAGEMLDLLHSMVGFYSRLTVEDIRVVLIHSREYILPTMDRELSAYAMEKLRGRGLDMVLGRRVKAMTSTRIYLDDGNFIEANTTVSTVGNAPHRIVSGLCRRYGLPVNRGRLVVGSDLRVDGFDNLWAAGDCAMVPMDGQTDEFCPPTAQFAMRQGELMGANIARALKGLKTRPFRFKGLGELASIGHRTAVADVMGVHLSGFPAWFLWRTIYLSKLPGWERRLRVVIDWTLDLFFPRDITLLNPRYTRLQKQVHLEAGDRLFSRGEPAFSLYVLKSGTIHLLDDDKVIRTIVAGEYFGERALLHNGCYRFNAVAAEPTQLISVSGETFLPLVHESRKMSLLFARTSAQSDPKAEFESLASKLAPGILDRPVSDIMVDKVVSLESVDTMEIALETIRRHRFSTYPVIDSGGLLVTSIAEDDFFNSLKRADISMDSPVMKADQTSIPVCRPDEPVSTAINQIIFSGRTKCFVTDAEGKLVGVIAILDMLAAR